MPISPKHSTNAPPSLQPQPYTHPLHTPPTKYPHPKHFKFPVPHPSNSPQTRTSYFAQRQKKLARQAPPAQTSILHGARVYFTGVKTASQRRLEGLVWRNGGEVCKVWYRKQVTHVVSDNLAAGKVEKEMRGIKRAAEIVSPLWIAECLRRGRKLPAGEFRIVRGPPDVVDVAKFFGVGKKGVSEGIVKKKRKGV